MTSKTFALIYEISVLVASNDTDYFLDENDIEIYQQLMVQNDIDKVLLKVSDMTSTGNDTDS